MRNSLLLLTIVGLSATCFHASAQIKAQGYDTPSYVQFSAPSYEVSQSETNAVVTIVRSGDFRKTASVDYTTREGTAAEGIDYQACGGTIVFAAGQSFRTITIPVVPSSEPVTKTFQVELTQPGFDTIITTPTASVEIQPLPPALNIVAKKGALVISWPDSGSAFVLEAQIDGQWSAVGIAPTLGDGIWSVTFTPTAPVALFRLRLDSQSSSQ
jgi:hypothetical protein